MPLNMFSFAHNSPLYTRKQIKHASGSRNDARTTYLHTTAQNSPGVNSLVGVNVTFWCASVWAVDGMAEPKIRAWRRRWPACEVLLNKSSRPLSLLHCSLRKQSARKMILELNIGHHTTVPEKRKESTYLNLLGGVLACPATPLVGVTRATCKSNRTCPKCPRMVGCAVVEEAPQRKLREGNRCHAEQLWTSHQLC